MSNEKKEIKIFPKSIIENTTQYHFQKFSKVNSFVYYLIILFLITAVLFCSYKTVDVSVNCNGITRPIEEKNEIRFGIGGVLESIKLTENTYVKKGSFIAKIKSEIPKNKISFLKSKRNDLIALINDLNKILANNTSTTNFSSQEIQLIYSHFLLQKRELNSRFLHIKKEYERAKQLYEGNSIPLIDLRNKEYEFTKLENETQIFVEKNKQQWQSELYRYTVELKELEANLKELTKQSELYTIRATSNGYIQNKLNVRPGNYIAAGQVLCVISPYTDLIGEFYITPHDIGLVKKGLKVKIQSNAFNYNEWGFIEGKVIDISNDVIEVDKQVFFKVKCKLNKTYFKLKNGYIGKLKNGMTLQAHINVSKRTILNLLFDDINDWLNPSQNNK